MRRIIVVVGLPGCGKDTVAGFLKERGIPVFGLGDVVRKEIRKRGLPITKDIQERIAKEMREKHGKDIFARLLARDIEKNSSETICVNGPRTLDELKYLEKYGDMITLEIVTHEKKRFERCRDRGNTWDPKSIEDIRLRDRSNLEKLGLDELLKTDRYPRYTIDNNSSKKELKKDVNSILERMKL